MKYQEKYLLRDAWREMRGGKTTRARRIGIFHSGELELVCENIKSSRIDTAKNYYRIYERRIRILRRGKKGGGKNGRLVVGVLMGFR